MTQYGNSLYISQAQKYGESTTTSDSQKRSLAASRTKVLLHFPSLYKLFTNACQCSTLSVPVRATATRQARRKNHWWSIATLGPTSSPPFRTQVSKALRVPASAPFPPRGHPPHVIPSSRSSFCLVVTSLIPISQSFRLNSTFGTSHQRAQSLDKVILVAESFKRAEGIRSLSRSLPFL